jgi:ABC-type transporter Mla subunit MlaD
VILDDAGSTLQNARTLLDRNEGKIEPLIADLSGMARSLERTALALDTLATNVNQSGLIEDLRRLADDLGPAGRDLAQLATRLDRLVTGNEATIGDTIRSLRDAVNELQSLLEELKANPSRILSNPPSKRTPGSGP